MNYIAWDTEIGLPMSYSKATTENVHLFDKVSHAYAFVKYSSKGRELKVITDLYISRYI